MSNRNDQPGQDGFDISFEEPAGAQGYPPAGQPPQGYTPEQQQAYYQQYYQQQQAYYQQQQAQAQGYYQQPTGSGVLTPPGAYPSQGAVSQSSRTIAEGAGGGGPVSQGPVSQSSRTIADGAGGGGPAVDFDSSDLVGKTIDRYRIVKLLGEGGFGKVYKAEHTLMKRDVAFKTLLREHAKDPAILHRFLREGQVAARFKHKHAIEVYDFGPLGDGSYFMAMEFLPGKDLRDHLKKRGALDLPETFDIMIMTLSALQAAHDGGVIHRDLKPDNIKLETREGRENYVKLLDFGIAKLKEVSEQKHAGAMSNEEAQRLMKEIGPVGTGELPEQPGAYKTQMGAFFGTPEYGSPEQCAGDEIDNRSDLYTMGVIMYECLTGSLPFVSKTPQGYLAQHMVAQPRPIREVRPDLNIPPEVEAVMMKALEKDRENRYQNANEFIEALVDCSKKTGIPITVEGGGTVVVKMATWKLATIVIVPIIVLSAIFFVLWKMKQDPLFDALQKGVAEAMNGYDWEGALKLLDDPGTQEQVQPKHPEYFDETRPKIEAAIKARDEQVGKIVADVKAAYEGAAVEDRNYADALAKLDLAINGKESSHSPLVEKLAKPLRDKIAADLVADAEALYKRIKASVDKRLDGYDFAGARDELKAWPAKFKETPSEKLIEGAYVEVANAERNIGEADLKAKGQLDVAIKFEQDNAENWAAIYAKYDEIIQNPEFKLTRAKTGAEQRKIDAKARQEKAAGEVFARIRAAVEELLRKGDDPAAFAAALTKYDEFPQVHAGTDVAGEVARAREATLQKAIDAWHAAEAKGKAEHDAGRIDAAMAAIAGWTSFPVSAIAEPARAEAATYQKNKAIHDDLIDVPGAKEVYIGDWRPGPASPPQGPFEVKPFKIMKHEVTNEQFHSFLEDTNQLGAMKPCGWRDGKYPAGQGRHPVRGVTWAEAVAFCKWAGLRLPDEIEWEYAARGADPFKDARDPNGKIDPKKVIEYPWGAQSNVQNVGQLKPANGIDTSEVGKFPAGASWCGALDMAGNVAEWTASEFQRYKNPLCPTADPDYGPQHRVYRGGSYNDNGFVIGFRSALRGHALPTARIDYVGFRCAKSAE
jgi:serine/threonine protein kinase/formylglycine-generating enzyme required for sulfatase activity